MENGIGIKLLKRNRSQCTKVQNNLHPMNLKSDIDHCYRIKNKNKVLRKKTFSESIKVSQRISGNIPHNLARYKILWYQKFAINFNFDYRLNFSSFFKNFCLQIIHKMLKYRFQVVEYNILVRYFNNAIQILRKCRFFAFFLCFKSIL